MCGLKYRDFRIRDYMDVDPWPHGRSTAEFRAAYAAQRQEHDRRVMEKNDYSQPPNRRAAVIGLLHQWKQEGWEWHLQMCEEAEEGDF